MDNEREELIRKFPVLKFFKYEHLPEVLQKFSKPFGDLAFEMAQELKDTPHPQELVKGLNKILEAKDCLVRARLPEDGTPIKKP